MVAASNQCGDHQKTKEKKQLKLEGKIKLETKYYYLLIFGAFLNRFCDMFCHPDTFLICQNWRVWPL